MTPLEVLKQTFGYDSFRGQQGEIIDRTLKGEDSLVLMPTGMGKSLCYQIPSVLLQGLTLVISPLIALMKDQVDQAKARGLSCTFINSSLSKSERESRYKNLSTGKYKLLYVTPERFQKKEFREALSKNEVSLIAIDEAHCVSQWGHDFRPDYTRIAEFRNLLNKPTTMALTATATPDVQKDILVQSGLKKDSVRVFSAGIDRPNIALSVVELHSLESKVEKYLELSSSLKGPGIIYFSLVATLEKFAELLHKKGHSFLTYHGQLPDRARKRSQDQFMASSSALILATNAFGLGVNKPDIRFVIHAELPGSIEAYHQEVGRSGRDGKPAQGILLFDEDDLATQMEFIKWSNPEPSFVRSVYGLIESSADRVNALGLDFIREQLNFYNRRDFRAETAVNLLRRWDCVVGEERLRNLAAVSPPPAEFLKEELHASRLKAQQTKLLDMLRYAQLKEGYRERILEYFGVPT